MQTNDFNHLMKNGYPDGDFDELEEQLKEKTKNLAAGMRTPTAFELKDMEKYKEEYKLKNPKASARNVRRAVQNKFNLILLPNT